MRWMWLAMASARGEGGWSRGRLKSRTALRTSLLGLVFIVMETLRQALREAQEAQPALPQRTALHILGLLPVELVHSSHRDFITQQALTPIIGQYILLRKGKANLLEIETDLGIQILTIRQALQKEHNLAIFGDTVIHR
jgi:hypothetical protein